MQLEQSFEVAASPERVFAALVDVERVTPCLPGAAVTQRNEDGSYDGEFKVRIGPTSAAYSGRLTMERVDEGARETVMHAAGTDKRGQGGAKTTITSRVSPGEEDGGASRVRITSDYTITGRLARFGRGGMIEEITEGLLAEFAANLQTMLQEDAGGSGDAAPAPAETPEATETVPPEAIETPEETETVPPEATETLEATGTVPPEATETVLPEATETVPVEDPDDAIAGAAPVAGPDETAAPTAPQTGPDAGTARATGASPGSSLTRRARENPAPVLALLGGFLLALRVLRRRS